MDKIIFQAAGTLIGLQSKINSLKITYEIDDVNVLPDHLQRFHDLKNKPSYITILPRQIQPEDVLNLPDMVVVEKGDKTPSQRLRACLYRLWEQDHGVFSNADDHYRHMMDKLINYVKEKLD